MEQFNPDTTAEENTSSIYSPNTESEEGYGVLSDLEEDDEVQAVLEEDD